MNTKKDESITIIREYMISKIGNESGGLRATKGIIFYIENENYLKILNRYGILILHYLMQYALDVEDYESCHLIHEAVRLNNDSEGTNYKLL